MELIIKIAAGIMLGTVVLPLLLCAIVWLLYLLYVAIYQFILQNDRLTDLRKVMKGKKEDK